MTTIEDTLTYIDGSKANGRLVVGWKPFTVGNVNAAGGELEWQIVEGAVSISLYANTGAQPTGSYYVVKYELENGAVYLEQWIVPELPTVNLGQVRVAFPPSPSVMISPLQLTSLGAAPGMFLMWNGQRWVPGYPGTFSFVDPTLVKGDMIVRGATAPATRLGVGLDGWTLVADSSQSLGIKWIAPVSGFADPTTIKGDLIVRGNSGTTRIGAGTNSWVLTADSAQTLGVKWAAVPLSPQTPWASDIDGAGFKLNSVSAIGIGLAATASYPLKVRVGTDINLGVQSGVTVAGAFVINAFNDAISANIPVEIRATDTVFIGSGTERMRITAAGNLGIGTTSPQALLDTSRPHDTGWNLRLSATGIANPGQACGMDFYDINNANQMATIQAASDLSFGASLQFWVKASTGTGGQATERMRIMPSGNVGIGTATPGAPLHVYKGNASNSSGMILETNVSGVGFSIYNTSVDGARRNWGIAANYLAYGDFVISQGVTPGQDPFAAASNIKLYINRFGAVGVSNNNPGYALDVAGDVNSSTVFRVQGLPAARVIAYLDQTGARALNVVYQNTQPAPIFVAVTATINQSQFMQLLTDLGNPPTNVVCTQSNASGSLTINQTLNGWVMPNHYYKVNAPSATLIKWFEWQ